jgi:uncharacterized membrane protein
MTATLASHPWAAPKSPSAAPQWQFARELRAPGDGASGTSLQWVLRRAGAFAPRQLVVAYLSLCLLAAAVCAGLWWQGARLLAALAGVELLLVGVALLGLARRAGDREVLTLSARGLAVEQHRGRRVARADFEPEWLSVEPAAGQGSLVELSGRGKTVRVGRHLSPDLRGAFAAELRRALRRTGAPEHETRDSN